MEQELAHGEEVFAFLPKSRTLQDYLRILLRRRWVTIITFFTCLGIYSYNTFTATPMYTATVQILMERHLPRFLETGQPSQMDYNSEEFYQTQYKLMESLALSERVADKLRQQNHSYYPAIFQSSPPPGGDKKSKQQTKEILAKTIRSGLTVSPVRNSRLINLNYTHSSPEFAADAANIYAQCFIEQALDLRFAISQETSDWLQKKLAEARKRLEDSETKLNRYKKEQNIVALEDKETITAQKLEQLNKESVSAQTRRLEAQTRYNEVNLGRQIPELENNPLIQSFKEQDARLSAQLSELSKKYGNKHPRIIQLNNELAAIRANMEAEKRHATQTIKNGYNVALLQEENLKKAMKAVTSETQDLSERNIQYHVLLRDVQTNRALYENILKSLKEVTATENVPATNIRIVYPATVPTVPISPQKSRNLLLGSALGLVLGLGLAIFLEGMDTTLKTPEDAESRLGIPNLAVIPHLQLSSNSSPEEDLALLVHNGTQPLAAEAYRSLRTSILFSTPGKTPQTIMVTSSIPLEGKSLTAVNLATVMAKADPVVLLVDADLRRPRLHQIFQVPKEPGLTNFLVGELDELPTISTQIPNLYLVPCGHIPPNPSELLHSEGMEVFLKRSQERFDRIIIDSPPLISVTDATILAAQVNGVLMVVKADTVPRKVAKKAIGQLFEVKAHVIGTIINDFYLKKDGYLYNRYYRYYSYYTPKEEPHPPGFLAWLKKQGQYISRQLNNR